MTRKYPLRRYILGVLTHTTAWDRHWGGDETLKKVLINADQLHLAKYSNAWISASPCLIDPRQGSEGDPECIFSPLDTYQETFISDTL